MIVEIVVDISKMLAVLIDFGLLGASVASGKKLFPRPSRFYHHHLSLEIAATSNDARPAVRDRLLERLCLKSRLLSSNSSFSMSSACPTVKLNNGLSIPILGLGTWKSKPGEVTKAVKDAIDVGYRHIDCAHVYQNEKEVGAAIKAKIDEGIIKREDIFVTSKLWNTFHKRELVEPALRTSLKNLSLSYLDLYLIHWPMAYKEGSELFPAEKNRTLYSDSPYTETWKAMEECVKKGLVKSIGISNFNKRQTQDILNVADIKPVTNQVECHPYLNQEPLMEFCAQHGIILTAYSPLGSPDRPMAKPEDPVLLDDPLFKKIGDKYGKTPGQILIRYQIERGNIVIPKSVNKGRIQQNFQVFDFKLSKEDMDLLNGIHKSNGRMIALTNQSNHKDYPFHDPF